MLLPKTLIIIFAWLCSMAAANKCLDPTQLQGECTSCQSPHFLFQGKCYDKIRGCLEHKISSQNIIQISCLLCQNGYVIDQLKCQRKAIVDLRKGIPIQALNNPSPLNSDNSTSLDKQNIKHTNHSNQQPEKQEPVKIKMPLKFPELKLVRVQDERALSQKYQQIPSDLQKVIDGVYHDLSKVRCFKFVPTNLENGEGKYLLIYEQGTILMVDKVEVRNGNNIKDIAEGSQKPQYLVMKIGRSMKAKNQFSFLKSRRVEDSILTKFSMNLLIRAKDPQNKDVFNLDLLSGDLTPDDNQYQSQKTSSFLLTKKSEYEKILKEAYAQFLKQIMVLNVPESIIDVKVYQSDQGHDVIFKVVYSVSNQTEVQYSVFKYKTDRNETQILGYFIQGTNVLAYFNTSNQTLPNITNSTSVFSEIKTSSQISGKQNQNQTTASSGYLEKKQFLNSSYPSSPNNESTKNQSNSAIEPNKNPMVQTRIQIANSSQTKEQQKPEVKTVQNLRRQQTSTYPQAEQIKNSTIFQQPQKLLNLSAEIKNISYILQILKSKPQFGGKVEKGYKIVSFETQVNEDKGQIIYNLKIFTPAGITLIKIVENVETNQFIESYSSESSESCLELPQNDNIFVKLDTLIRKSYTMLQNFSKSSAQYKIDQNSEKYLIIYSNEQAKKVFYQVNKVKDTAKFSIVKSGLHEFGYFFQKKDLQNMSLKISDFEELKYENSQIKSIKSALNELVQRFKPYVNNSIVVAALTNNTHLKIYVSNKMSTFEFVFKMTEVFGRGTLNLVDKKYGYDIWPVGTKSATVANSDVANYQKIEEAIVKKYKSYFNNGTNEIFLKKSSNNQYDIAFKTFFGYVCLTVTVTVDNQLTFGLLKKNSDFDEPKTTQPCRSGQLLDAQDKKCYPKVVNCYKQIGNICISCEIGFILQTNMKQCKRACAC